ncbi:heterokaryon incompatibility protein [Colletotrichum truncatum]|uniref:Heterokaryon incompatibility protein n=1 Tax=Colletotrichum truncatum TaxID=5467 RepID=A0ACC3ZH70_COLTU|nr:heterokaryon incompatibility protein [Colletotrichum truncatum]KAF6790620.1 heterokaryon incompatibility protein [Colletotrichum truncatum]
MAAPRYTRQLGDLGLLGNWISNCTQNHPQCQNQSHETWFPTRLLQISNGGQSVKLILTKDEPPVHPYITLSHRWGDVQYDKLTSDTIERFQLCIDISKLPQVFQNSIALAWRLGIHYLWIDSLCIKQDPDLSDWKKEALLMQKVYSHSLLNLSASHIDVTGNQALHRPRPWDVFRPTKVIMEIDRRKKAYWLIDGDIWNDEVEAAPLIQRAWVFQERFLASRVLHFGQRQLAWECNQLTALEMFPAGLPSVLLPQSKSEILATLIQDQSQGTFDYLHLREAWSFLVGKYSVCELTNKDDKLIAFSGVAKMVEACITDEYIAGSWKSTLIYDLGWYRAGTDSEKWPSSHTSHRAPSWSWMAVDGEIFFPSATEAAIAHFAKVLKYPTPGEVGTSAFQARGQLELECVPLILNSVKWAGDTIAEFEIAGIRITDDMDASGSHLDLEGSKGEITSLIENQGVCMVPLFATNLAVFAVMVSKEKVSGDFIRVGAAQIEYGKRLPTPLGKIPKSWMKAGSSPFIVHKTTAHLLEHIVTAQKGSRSVIKLK